MANIKLTWTPAATNIGSQKIYYRISPAGSYVLYSTVAANIGTVTIGGMDVNKIYQFKIESICTVGGPTSSLVKQIAFECPSPITTTPAYNSCAFSFTGSVGTSVSAYSTAIKIVGGGTLSTITGTSGNFTSLDPETTYTLTVTVTATDGIDTFTTSVCTKDITTPAAPICYGPTDVVATIV